MRILAVCAVAQPGGAEIGLLRLGRRLVARGHELTITTPEPGPMDEQGFPTTRLRVGGIGARQGATAVLSWPRARRLAHQADLVYLNGTVAGRLLPALRTKPTVLHVHDMVDRVPGFWRHADAIMADSTAVAENLNGLHADVIYCPVELDVEPAPVPWPQAPGPVIGFVGRLEPRKGPLDLVEAAPLIRAHRPDARIVLVGDDPYASDPAYLQKVKTAPGVEHVPWVQDGAAVMAHMDVLVAPSRQEPFGTVLAEAQAAGTPVVATLVGGLRETVADGRSGRLVEPGDPPALARAVLDVLARRDEFSGAAREHAQQFGADVYADRVEQILRRAAGL